ncbi:gamma-glutamyltransferase [Roseovarius sp. E0-M6]|uniref:gamma-glutamyltransferase n=1 Tax=Roseovarius sp. E0-M6 TaxID=3127118 RepID=UPI00301007F2
MQPVRPITTGGTGAVSAAHPLATGAGLKVLALGGNACDAMIAAQAALAVVAPASCGLGGDMLALMHDSVRGTGAINGTGAAPMDKRFTALGSVGLSVTVPGLAEGWCEANATFGRLPLSVCLAPAVELARKGCPLSIYDRASIGEQAERLKRGGAERWAVIREAAGGAPVPQPEMARLLERIGAQGRDAFYEGAIAAAMARAVQGLGGLLSEEDLACQRSELAAPLSVPWGEGTVEVQPPMTQGVLLAMSLKGFQAAPLAEAASLDHLCIELTEASFQFRERAAEGAALLEEPLEINLKKSSGRGGPRAYLHTAGVATADSEGQVCSSLVSVFDSFGSCIYVPEGGFALNNRAEGFTTAPNEAAPGKRPVHTLAPMLLHGPEGATALATPGADGQVQTLLQILARMAAGADIASAIHAPRWRSEDGRLLMAENHRDAEQLRALGHDVEFRADNDLCFGGVVCAGIAHGRPFAGSDWRREVWHAVL